DFQTVAEHELGHLLGFGTSPQFTAYSVEGHFTGANATAAAGAPPALAPDGAHFAQGTRSGADPVIMEPTLEANRRTNFSALDYAVLADLGWQLTAVSPPPTSPPAGLAPGARVTVVSGPTDGSVRLYTAVADGTPAQGGGSRVRVFGVAGGSAAVKADFFGIDDPAFRGGARAAAGDVNGDGTPDLVVAAGFGGGPRVSVLDGRTVLTGRRATL